MSKIRTQDLTGQRFGKLIAVERLIQEKGIKVKYKCNCDCGKTSYPTGNSLVGGVTSSCGCGKGGKGKKETPEQKTSKLRAGIRKCARCKGKYYKPHGVLLQICDSCRIRCNRCDGPLNQDTFSEATKKRNAYTCKVCTAEKVKRTRGNKGFNQKEYDLLRHYFITLPEYEALFEAQNGVCYICQKPPVKNRLSVDHKHEKGERKRDTRLIRKRIRGLLCWTCNKAIAYLKDSPENTRRAASYLEDWPAQKILIHKDGV